MRRTGLSRPSFYVYFKDRHELVLRLVQHLQAEMLAVASRWYESIGGGPGVLRDALDGVVKVYGEHGPVLRALSDAAVEDPDVQDAYESLVQSFVDVTAQHIEAEMTAGHIAPLDAGETSKALVWMTERYLYHSFGPVRRVAAGRVTETLASLWTRTLYQSS